MQALLNPSRRLLHCVVMAGLERTIPSDEANTKQMHLDNEQGTSLILVVSTHHLSSTVIFAQIAKI